MKSRILAVLAAMVALSVSCTKVVLSSPDGRLTFNLECADSAVFYSVSRDGSPLLEKSSLGLLTEPYGNLSSGVKLIGVNHYSGDEIWEQIWGESRFVRDHHNGLLLTFRNADGVVWKLNVRAFDDGFGFRYEFPETLGSFDITDDLTSFNFVDAGSAWWMDRARYEYYEAYGEHTSFDEITTAYTPLVVTGNDGLYYAIHEAAVLDFAKSNIVSLSSSELKCDLVPLSDGVKVHVGPTRVSPWRTLCISDTPGGLYESNIMLNLNEPCKIEDTSWIKPGKYVGIWWILHKFQNTWFYDPANPSGHGATTERTMRYIDFAANNDFQAVLVEGWNLGWNGNWMQHSSEFDFLNPYPDYDWDKVMSYAREKGVQMVIHNETAANTVNYFSQIDSAFAKYQAAGMHYVKTGNVNLLMDGKEEHDSQYGVNRLHQIVEKAAEYQICIDEHEPCIPTGVGRTWPNLMTHEAVRGQEHDAWEKDGGNRPEHQTIVPFLRGLAGPMDYTFGTFDFSNPKSPFSRVRTTIAKQLAEYVVIYSPLQMASDDPSAYEGNPAFKFIHDVPADWHTTKVLDASIGDYVVMARKDRNSEDWYLGALTDENARELQIPLDFLEEGEYEAQIYCDSPLTDYESNPALYEIKTESVNAQSVLAANMARSGGIAVRFVKK